MRVCIYSKEGCGKCDAAKEKMEQLGIDYEEHKLEYHITLHENWKNDGSVDLLAWCAEQGDPKEQLPTIQIDDDFFTYSAAMRRLKTIIKQHPSSGAPGASPVK